MYSFYRRDLVRLCAGSDDSAGPALRRSAAVQPVRLVLRPAVRLVHAAQLRRPTGDARQRSTGR